MHGQNGRSALKPLTAKAARNKPLGRPMCRWEDNIRMNLKEITVQTKNCIEPCQYRDYLRVIVNAALNLQIP